MRLHLQVEQLCRRHESKNKEKIQVFDVHVVIISKSKGRKKTGKIRPTLEIKREKENNPSWEPRGSLFSWTKTSAGASWCKTSCGKQIESSTSCEMKQENWTLRALSCSSSWQPAGQTGERQHAAIVWVLQRPEPFPVLHSAFIGLLKNNYSTIESCHRP